MNMTIIRNHNNRVKPTDTVYFLGDFCFKNTAGGKEGEGEVTKFEEYISQLNGNFVFILGNHDYNNGVKSCLINATLEITNRQINLVHNPEEYDPSFKINFVGHVHQKWKFQRRGQSVLINVGCDVWRFMPVNINEIMAEYEKFIREEKK